MVYENATSFPLTEDMTDVIATPTTGYGLSKLIGERMLKEYSLQYGINYVIWRPFSIITPYEQSDSESGISHVFADFIKKIVIDKNKEIEIFGNGEQTRCFTWIDDIAKIIAEQSFSPLTDREIYNVGNEEPTKVIDLAKMIFKLSGRTDAFCPKFVSIYDDDVKYRVPSSAKVAQIGWQHTKSTSDLINICVNEALKLEQR
jgi:nucleoside-diphosphate-sugar epimerase